MCLQVRDEGLNETRIGFVFLFLWGVRGVVCLLSDQREPFIFTSKKLIDRPPLVLISSRKQMLYPLWVFFFSSKKFGKLTIDVRI